jgi:peptidoglycan/LPS O-acetylase OafA/YrhL
MSRRLLLLLGLGVLGVVLNHATVYGFRATFEWWWRAEPELALAEGCDLTPPVRCTNYDAVGSPTYWGLTLVRRLISFGVPAFLLVSGYFIAFAAGKEKPARHLAHPAQQAADADHSLPHLVHESSSASRRWSTGRVSLRRSNMCGAT